MARRQRLLAQYRELSESRRLSPRYRPRHAALPIFLRTLQVTRRAVTRPDRLYVSESAVMILGRKTQDRPQNPRTPTPLAPQRCLGESWRRSLGRRYTAAARRSARAAPPIRRALGGSPTGGDRADRRVSRDFVRGLWERPASIAARLSAAPLRRTAVRPNLQAGRPYADF